MAIPAVSPNFLDTIFVSNTKEATQGTAQTLDTAFFPEDVSIVQMTKSVLVPVVTGLPGATKRVITSLSSGGDLKSFTIPALINWMMRFAYSKAPTNAAAGASVTAYVHTFGGQGVTTSTPPWTFTFLKQIGGSVMIEKLCGLCITGFDISCKDGLISLTIKTAGMGSGYDPAASVPAMITPLVDASQDYFVGVTTNLKIDGTPIAKSLFHSDWSIAVSTGYEVCTNAGSTDKSATGVRWKGGWKASAKFTLDVIDNSWLADFVGFTTHTYEFDLSGATIDVANAVKAGATFKFMQARNLNKIDTIVKQGETVTIPFDIEAEWDTASSHALEVTTTDLVAAP